MSDLSKVPWVSAGTIAVATIVGWFWLISQFMLREEIVEDLGEIKVQLYALQWQDAKRAVRWWEGQEEWPTLRPNDRQQYEDSQARVIHYRNEVLKAGGSIVE